MKIRYTPEALRDLQHISASIMEKFDNETVEKRVLQNITKTIRGLEVFPYKGVEVQPMMGVLTDYRYIFNEKNYVFYRIGEEEVSIIRILNEKQDYMRVLFGITKVEEEDYSIKEMEANQKNVRKMVMDSYSDIEKENGKDYKDVFPELEERYR